MKKLLLILLISLFAQQSYSNSFYFGWDGFGMATRNNFNMAMSYGAYYYSGIAFGTGLGATEFYQRYNTYYSRENRSTVGGSLRADVTYRFFSPMVVFQLSHSGQSQVYFTGGIGELQSGGEAIYNKWSRAPWSNKGEVYDSTIDFTPELNKYIFRIGFGFTQFMRLGGNFHMFINEDAGVLATPISDVSGRQYSDLKTNAAQFFQPTYISIRVGIGLITHSKELEHPWQIYPGKPND
jgi:hypothetical protein